MSRLGLLVNPTSGGGRGAATGARPADALRRGGHDVVPVPGPRVLVEADPHLGAQPPVASADGERLGPLPLRAGVVPGALAVLA